MSDCLCFAVLGDVAGATESTLPVDTSAIVVQRFNDASAVSEAVYVLFGPSPGTPPGYPLAVRNIVSNNWYVIHPDYVTLEAAGAPSDVTADCAPAMQNVLNYFAYTGNAALKLWERDYVLNSISTLNPAPASSGFSIIGKGQTVSRLVVPCAGNSSGAIAITFFDNTSQYLLRDFSVVASGVEGSEELSAGTAILMNGPGGAGHPKQYGGIVERLHMGSDLDSSGNGYGYFTTGLDVKYTSRPLISQTTVSGCEGNFIGDDFSDSSPLYFMQTGIDVSECYSPISRDTRVWNATTGLVYDSPSGKPQGFDFSGCNFESVRKGVYVRHGTASCPNGIVANSSFAFRDVGVDMGNIDIWRFPGNLFFLQGSATDRGGATAYDMKFILSSKVTITGSSFSLFNDDAGAPGNHICISIGTDAPPGTGGDTFLIDTSLFGDGNANFATSAIELNTSAFNIQIGASNFYNGNFTEAVVVDASGTAMTSVGFPTTDNPDNPAAVVPNSVVASNLVPLLGTDANPWLVSFAYGQYIPATPAAVSLPTISSGWGFFVRGGALIARAWTGAEVTLGTP